MKQTDKITAIIILVLLGGAAGYLIAQKQPTATLPPPPPPPVSPSDWKIWQDGEYSQSQNAYYGYALKYPRDFERYQGDMARGNLIGTPRVTIAFPADAFKNPKTNYGEAYLTVSIGKDSQSIAQCYTNPNPNNPNGNFDSRVMINGTEFRKAFATDVGAGNIYTSEIYRVLRDNRCYEIALTVHTGNIHNFDPGTVTEFDKENAFSVLRQIRDTFMFTNENPYQ